MGLNKLVDTIRAKYPGSYDDMDDATLTKSVLAKYPQYSDLAAPSVGSTGAPPNNAIVRDAAKAQSNVRAAGPYTQPGAAEAGMGFGTPASQTLQDAGQAVAQGANVAAPVLTGGASLPVQMAVQGATSGAQTATEGGSGKDIAKSAAIGAVIPAAAHGVAALG